MGRVGQTAQSARYVRTPDGGSRRRADEADCCLARIRWAGERTLNLPSRRFRSLLEVGREHIFDPFHECADPARQIAPMGYDERRGDRPTTQVR